ncbi:MAG TPA: hypothetical protein VL979_04985 [Solirubrobacteraceae bacterium]|nr:hypothetical protein [Solirubrobacteraceae bacterium]
MSRTIIALAAVLAACAAGASTAAASERVALHARLFPDRLGASTTIGFGFEITSTEGGLPAPLESVSLQMPPGINYLSTTLGLAICHPAALLAHGLSGCSPNSRLGSGSAFVEVPFGQTAGHEIPEIQALMGPPHNGNVVVLFYASGLEPVFAQILFEGELIAGSQTTSGRLNASVPLIPSVAGGPPVSIVRVDATIGPAGLTYYERVHGHTLSFHPVGVSVPLHCPGGGFPFSARFSFADGTSTVARAKVPCPHRH